MSYQKLEEEEPVPPPSKSTTKSPASSSSSKAKSKSRSKRNMSSKAETTANLKDQLEERKNALKQPRADVNQVDASTHKIQTELDHDLAVAIAAGGDAYIPPSQQPPPNDDELDVPSVSDQDGQSDPGSSAEGPKCGKGGISGLCILWQRGDKFTLIGTPILLLCMLLVMLATNSHLMVVWILCASTFYALLIFAYFYAFPMHDASDSVLDLFSFSLFYGGVLSLIGWIFAWLLAMTNNILVGPFLFYHSGFIINSTTNSVLFGVTASLVYGGVFPVLLIWLKADRRTIDSCCCKHCKLKNYHILREYEGLQQRLNLPGNQALQFMAQNEAEIVRKLDVAMKRLQMECVCTFVGYFGAIYFWSFLSQFSAMNTADTTLIFVLGYLVKDFVFAVLVGIVCAYVIGRERLYGIHMNPRWFYYGEVALLGAWQQMVGTVLCGLYPHVMLRMRIVYVCIGANALICLFCVYEIMRQKKLFTVQKRALFLTDAIHGGGAMHVDNVVDENSMRMEQLSGVYVEQ